MIQIKINTPESQRPPAVNYLEYAELLSRMIAGCAVPHQREQVMYFEQDQPENCPHCGICMRSCIKPHRIIHDAATCPKRMGT